MFKSKKPTLEDLGRFFRILRRYSNAGIPPKKCIEQYQKTCMKESLKNISSTLIEDLGNGMNFADSLRKHSFFPSYVVELIAVGEKTGQLNEFLEEIVFFLEQDNDIQRELKSSLLPIKFLLTGALIAFIVAVFVVIPRIGDILVSFNAKMPMLTQFVVWGGALLQNHWLLMIIMALMIVIISFYIKKEHPDKYSLFKLNTPFTGKILCVELQYKFCKIVALCDGAGVSIHKAFQFAAMAIDNTILKKTLHQAAKDLKLSGSQPAVALTNADTHKVLREEIYTMLKAGQETGQLSKILNDEAEEYRKEILRLSKNVGNKVSSSIIVPIMIFIGILVVSVYIPLFSMMEAGNVGKM